MNMPSVPNSISGSLRERIAMVIASTFIVAGLIYWAVQIAGAIAMLKLAYG
jgi:hypothetical protein